MMRCVPLSLVVLVMCAASLPAQESRPPRELRRGQDSRLPWESSAAQESRRGLEGRPTQRLQLTLDVGAIGGSLGLAWRIDERRSLGVGGGVGGDLFGYMLVAGRHFAEESGLSYQPKDGYRDKFLLEVAHLNAFVRQRTTSRWEFDVGLRGSSFIHYDSSDDDPGGGLFLGGFAAAYYRFRALKVGPRLLFGAFRENRAEFGVYVVPLTIRFAFGGRSRDRTD